MSLPLLALISVRPPPSGSAHTIGAVRIKAIHVRRLFAFLHHAGACSAYSVFKVLSPSYLIQLPPLTFRHTMPAIAYVSGRFSLPSAADARGRFGHRGSRFGFLGALAAWLSPRSSSDLKVRVSGALGQPLPAGLWIGTQCQGSHHVEGNARERTR